MKFAYLSLAAILAARVTGASLSVPASAGTDHLHALAVHACTTANAAQPVDFVAAVDDGRGGSLDTGEGLVLCDATADAQVWGFAEIGDPLSLGNPVG